jgi:hypothetical protein
LNVVKAGRHAKRWKNSGSAMAFRVEIAPRALADIEAAVKQIVELP